MRRDRGRLARVGWVRPRRPPSAARAGWAARRAGGHGRRRPVGVPGAVLDRGADGTAFGSCDAGLRRPSRPAARAPWRRPSPSPRPWPRRRARPGSGRGSAGRRAARRRVGPRRPSTAPLEVHRLGHQLALDVAGEAGVPLQLEGGEQVELVAEGLRHASDVHGQDAVAADGRRRRSRSAGSRPGGGRTSRSWSAPSRSGSGVAAGHVTYREYVPRVWSRTAGMPTLERRDAGHPPRVTAVTPILGRWCPSPR